MARPFIPNRVALADAADLMQQFGPHATVEAGVRAARSRSDGNVARFCHWRQIERLITLLASEEVTDTVH